MANPTLLTMPLCVNADKNTIPPTDAGTSGLFSEEYGWQNINSLPLASGGKAPNRRDFNGVFALLGGIAYACQRGYTFEWDSTQDYVVGCVVLDTNDNKRYECIADVTANATPPNADTTHWKEFGTDTTGLLTAEITPAFNKCDVITTSGTYTAPVTGWYKVTAKGGGGGGGGGYHGTTNLGGAGGGSGGTTIVYIHMTASDTATVTIGGGGAGGAVGVAGTVGGDTAVTIAGTTYTAGGGEGSTTNGSGGSGGTGGTFNGACGETSYNTGSNAGVGASGGGVGGGVGGYMATGSNGVNGAGGGGGGAYTTSYAGGNGGDGYVWFEYFDTSLNP